MAFIMKKFLQMNFCILSFYALLSLSCESPLDHRIKSEVIADLFNLACIRPFDSKKLRNCSSRREFGRNGRLKRGMYCLNVLFFDTLQCSTSSSTSFSSLSLSHSFIRSFIDSCSNLLISFHCHFFCETLFVFLWYLSRCVMFTLDMYKKSREIHLFIHAWTLFGTCTISWSSRISYRWFFSWRKIHFTKNSYRGRKVWWVRAYLPFSRYSCLWCFFRDSTTVRKILEISSFVFYFLVLVYEGRFVAESTQFFL